MSGWPRSAPRKLSISGGTAPDGASGAEALNAIGISLCDCLIVDQKMPGMSGLDLIAKLRDRHDATPAILITSNPSPALREQAKQAEVPIVEKPLLGNALLEKIRHVVAGGPR